jgi:diguanylate cyclase (GGDEF)-like protein/PAS domain S-box-containing protein
MAFAERSTTEEKRTWWWPKSSTESLAGDFDIYKSAFEAMAVGVAICEADGRIVHVNRRLCDIIGLSSAEIASRPFGGQIHFQDEAARAIAIQRLLNGEVEEYVAERRYLRSADGADLWLRLTVSADISKGGRRSRLVAVVEDISALKAHENDLLARADKQQHLAALSASLPGALCIYRQQSDGSSRPEFVTAAFRQVFGYSPQNNDGGEAGNFKNVHPDDVAGLLASITEAARDRKPWRAEYRVKHPEKGILFVEESSAPEVDADGSLVWYCFLQDVTAQKRAEQKLTEQQSLFSSILATALDGVVSVDRNRNIAVFNAAAERMFKLKSSDVIGQHYSILTKQNCANDPVFAACLSDSDHTVGIEPQVRRLMALRGDGSEFPIEMSVSRAEVGGQEIYTAILRDISERERDEAGLRQAAAVFENSQESICITDPKGIVTAVNPAFRKVTGFSANDIAANPIGLLKIIRVHPGLYRHIMRSVMDFGTWQGEALVRNKFGIELPQWVVVSTVRNSRGEPANYVVSSVDISRIKQTEKQLNHLALHDTLTGLPNRHMLHRRLAKSIENSRSGEALGAVLFIDLDRFKVVNDSLGHQAGDDLLRYVAKRLTQRVRGRDTVARLGGDEFVVILDDIGSYENAGKVAHDIIALIEEPVAVLGGHEVYVSASIGISFFPKDGENASDLLQSADTALYLAKDSGRGSYRFYDVSLTLAANAKLEMESRMRRALLRDEFTLHYQPIIDVVDRRVIGAEALIRWNDPLHGFIQPLAFIPLAEDTGFIVPLGEWVIRTACAQFKAWRSAGVAIDLMSINLSARQFRQIDLPQRIEAILSEMSIDPGCIEFEITESALMEGGNDANKKLDALKALGVRLSIDDFGTGYSSLSCLKRFPLDTLKVDRSFVRDVCTDPTARQITLAIISLAKTLNLKLIAEGVETSEQAEFLMREGCDMLQGYLFSKPLAPASFRSWLEVISATRFEKQGLFERLGVTTEAKVVQAN